jgi:hypothetical protein
MSNLRKVFPWLAALGALTAGFNFATEYLKARREKKAEKEAK